MSLRSLHCPKFDWSKKILEFQIFLDYKIKFRHNFLKFIYSEKATKVCEISTEDLSYVVPVKSTEEISQTFVAFSEYMNFNKLCLNLIL